MQAEQTFFIGIQDIGANNEITNKALLEALTNTANVHGKLVGQGTNDKPNSHLSWVVLNWKLQVLKRPKVCETILVKTWAQEYARVEANRDYDILNESGEIVAIATSKWLAVDTESGTLVRLTPEIMDIYGCEPQHKNFPDFKFAKNGHPDLPIIKKITFNINKSMIDCNNHVHNAAYLDLANEVLPDGLDRTHFNNAEVNYKKEIKPNDTVSVEYAIYNGKHYIFIKDEDEQTLHSTIILY